MPFELRSFVLKNGADIVFHKGATFKDLYIFKKGLTKVGIKIRDPQHKKNHNEWKINHIEIKQEISQSKLMPALQNWEKQIVKFQFRLNIDNITEFNKKLCKVLDEQILDKNQQLKKWINQEINEIYILKKQKIKVFGNEKGFFRVRTFIKKTQDIFFETNCVEGSQQKIIGLMKQQKHNYSFPDLLQCLWSENIKQFSSL